MPIYELGDLTDIRTGQAFPGKLEDDPEGDYFVANSRAVTEENSLDAEGLVRMSSKTVKPFKCLERNDVLLTAKGSKRRAVLFDLMLEPVVASSFFLILKAVSPELNPAYLAWFLNHPNIRKQLATIASGATVAHLSIKRVSRFEIKLPVKEIQNKIVRCAYLAAQEQHILKELNAKKKAYWDKTLIQLVESST